MAFNPLSDLLHVGFTIIEICLFMVAKTWKQKYAYYGFHWKDSDVFLIEELPCLADLWKEILVELFYFFIELLNLLPPRTARCQIFFYDSSFSFLLITLYASLFAPGNYPVGVNFEKFYFQILWFLYMDG